jgi:transposase
MPWTDSARLEYARLAERYATDLTDAEWALLAPHLPAPSRLGRPRQVDLREVLNAILYLLRTGCPWRLLPKEFPPRSTVFGYFRRLWEEGTWLTLHATLHMSAREQAGREASPSAGVVDSQSVRSSESGGPKGFDAGKKVSGRKRHILVDTLGLLLVLVVHTADIQDRDGLALVCRRVRRRFPWLRLVFADAGYQGETAACAAAQEGLRLEIVARDKGRRGFQLLPRRWVVERTFAWFGRNRRLTRDVEATLTSALTMVYLASIQLMLRRLARA